MCGGVMFKTSATLWRSHYKVFRTSSAQINNNNVHGFGLNASGKDTRRKFQTAITHINKQLNFATETLTTTLRW